MINKKSPVGTRKKHISKLSLKFIGIVVLAAVVSASLFGFLFFNRYRIFHLAVGEKAVQKETSEQIQTLQNTITKKEISKKNRKAIKREMRKYKDLTLYLYDEEDTLSETSFSAMAVSYTHLDVYKRQGNYYIVAADPSIPLCSILKISDHGLSGSGITPDQPYYCLLYTSRCV